MIRLKLHHTIFVVIFTAFLVGGISIANEASTILLQKKITVGFENHEDGTKYNQFAQEKDWDVVWSKENWMDNYAFITASQAHSGNKSLRITHRPDARTGGNALWQLPEAKEYYLSYWVKFADDFDFDGTEYATGKLPGLGGAGGLCVGGTNGFQPCTGDNGFSARYFWREDGRAVLNLKHMDIPTSNKWTPDLRLVDSDGNDKYFIPGQWHHLIQRVRINDGNQANGEVEVWMDGEQVLSVEGYRFVNNNRGIDNLYFNTFHGGSEDARWWPDHTVYSYWDDFVVSTNPADVGL